MCFPSIQERGPNTDFDLPFNIRSIELMPGKDLRPLWGLMAARVVHDDPYF